MQTSTLVKQLKQNNQDFEWYPTTDEILKVISADISVSRHSNYSLLDIGAGNGKAMDYFFKNCTPVNSVQGIEKSQILIDQWSKQAMICGVDFHKTSLMDKSPDIIFCNPPYLEWKAWTKKIIEEAHCQYIYFVIPERWKNEDYFPETSILGSFDFYDAERQARAKVDIVKIKRMYRDDPFKKFFDETFSYPEMESFEGGESSNDLVVGDNLIESLCKIYDARLETLRKNYQAICDLDYSLLLEFELSKDALLESLKSKISTLKKQMWRELFKGLDKINERLTKNSRENIVNLMNKNTGVDFNRENCYSVVMWVIRHSNEYFDKQLVDTFERMVDFANVESYKSNYKVFVKNDYYGEKNSHYKLKTGHRIVLDRCGGLDVCPYSGTKGGITERACDFINDLFVIANNLGYKVIEKAPVRNEWKDSSNHTFHYNKNGDVQEFAIIKAFYNGNMHIKFSPEFINMLNVQHGKLKGWIKNRYEAEKEFDNGEEFF